MATRIPMLSLLYIHEPDVGIMYQSRCLQRLARLLLGQLGGGKLAKLIIHQRQQLLCC